MSIATAAPPLRPELFGVYDATETPRAQRGTLPLLGPAEAADYLTATLGLALDALEWADLGPGAPEIDRGGLVFDLLVEHEEQHRETMLQALHLAPPGTYASADRLHLTPVAGGEAATLSGHHDHPYPGHSEIHFGQGHRVLRGGSWASSPSARRRVSFRNWDLPARRQIFAGVRLAVTA